MPIPNNIAVQSKADHPQTGYTDMLFAAMTLTLTDDLDIWTWCICDQKGTQVKAFRSYSMTDRHQDRCDQARYCAISAGANNNNKIKLIN